MPRYLYRRPSGIYAVRISVPERLRDHFGRREIHVSTRTSDPIAAKATAFAILSAWQQRVVELRNMDILKIAEGSPLLAGTGYVRVQDVEQEFSVPRITLLNELKNASADLYCCADGWKGFVVSDIVKVDREPDGTYLMNDARDRGVDQVLFGEVLLYRTSFAIADFEKSDVHTCGIFFLDDRKRRTFFCPNVDQDQVVHYSQVMIRKMDFERIRTRMAAGISTDTLDRAKAALDRPVRRSPHDPVIGGKYADLKASSVMERFLEAKAPDWKPDRQERMRKACERFIELMDDPLIVGIDRYMVREYQKRLLQLPINVVKAKAKYGTSSLKALIQRAGENSEETMASQTAADYVDKLSEMFSWAVIEEYMQRNPATGITSAGSNRVGVRQQDQRDQFDEGDLAKIFSADWFTNGMGAVNKFGRFRDYMPHYYWLPLLGLFTGARLNELAQLYLDDVRQDGDGTWFLDFNLVGANKMDETAVGDKSLKTVNSQRQVPMHPELIKLGLPEYAQALANAGHDRLFPELTYDSVKGYGKPAGSWFNERYLGKRLKMPRDGKKTFHSFRHTFTTAIYAANVPQQKVAQILGHERGESMSEARYNKDKGPTELLHHVAEAIFKLPPISPFRITSGLEAVTDALKRKAQHARNVAKR